MSFACPATERLAAALRARQSSSSEADLAEHLADCAACRARLEELAGGSAWLESRAKARAFSSQPKSQSLQKLIETLESRAGALEPEPRPLLDLDFLQPSDQPGALGRFGPFEVLEQIAGGGMGIVLKARDPRLDRVVALKILPPALATNPLARARFVREARAAAAVVHEHVVPSHAVDEFNGLPYLVMQFVLGRTLAERIKTSGKLQLEEILRIGAQTAAGLAAAHAQGLIHRDVKPGNILLENAVERVKITDFGLARATDDASLTREGAIAGTPEYMSPEQADGRVVDPRTDLFSLGCVLYEMATGVSPFHAETPLAAMRRVCEQEPPPPHGLNPALPEWLGGLIQRLMAKDPGARPASAADVASRLTNRLAEARHGAPPHRFVPGPGPPPHSGPERRPTRLQARLLLLAIPALTLLFMVFLRPRPASSPFEDSSSAVPSRADFAPAASAAASARFVVLAMEKDGGERGFGALSEATQAAPAGGVISARLAVLSPLAG